MWAGLERHNNLVETCSRQVVLLTCTRAQQAPWHPTDRGTSFPRVTSQDQGCRYWEPPPPCKFLGAPKILLEASSSLKRHQFRCFIPSMNATTKSLNSWILWLKKTLQEDKEIIGRILKCDPCWLIASVLRYMVQKNIRIMHCTLSMMNTSRYLHWSLHAKSKSLTLKYYEQSAFNMLWSLWHWKQCCSIQIFSKKYHYLHDMFIWSVHLPT